MSFLEVKGISDHAKEVGDSILEQISAELHNFYTFDMHLNTYAARHAKLIRLIPIASVEFILFLIKLILDPSSVV